MWEIIWKGVRMAWCWYEVKVVRFLKEERKRNNDNLNRKVIILKKRYINDSENYSFLVYQNEDRSIGISYDIYNFTCRPKQHR